MATEKNPGELTYEQARDELIGIVAKLEAGSVSLDDSLALWERGEALAVRCQGLLEDARKRVDKARGDQGVPAPVEEGA
ncbi:MAG: exodeoxyribonuclease VII small subunit [Demequinaceae bacterium]|nr:exodeoxyribonuclease VII small subunit [Demequinaceae bacterium]